MTVPPPVFPAPGRIGTPSWSRRNVVNGTWGTLAGRRRWRHLSAWVIPVRVGLRVGTSWRGREATLSVSSVTGIPTNLATRTVRPSDRPGTVPGPRTHQGDDDNSNSTEYQAEHQAFYRATFTSSDRPARKAHRDPSQECEFEHFDHLLSTVRVGHQKSCEAFSNAKSTASGMKLS